MDDPLVNERPRRPPADPSRSSRSTRSSRSSRSSGSRSSNSPRSRSSRTRPWLRRPIVLLLIGLALAVGGFGAFRSARAGQAALRGKAALLRAEKLLGARQLEPARAQLMQAGADFERSRHEIEGLVRFLPFARHIPLVGSQIQGVEDLSDVGVLLSDAGVRLADAASRHHRPRRPEPEALRLPGSAPRHPGPAPGRRDEHRRGVGEGRPPRRRTAGATAGSGSHRPVPPPARVPRTGPPTPRTPWRR